MTLVEATFKDATKQPIKGFLEVIPENQDTISSENQTIFVNKKTEPKELLFGSISLDLLPGRYIFSLKDTVGNNSTSFSAYVPETNATLFLSDLAEGSLSGKIASSDELGVIRVGEGLEIDEEGVLSVSSIEIDSQIASRLGVQTETRIYVSPKAPPHNDAIDNNGQSPLKPFRSIERALAQAAISQEGVTIELAPGEYWVDNRPGKSSTDVIALKNNAVEFAKITNKAQEYGKYQDAAALVRLNLAWIANEAFLQVGDTLASDGVTLTPDQSKLCKRDLRTIVKFLANDLEEMGNKHIIACARTYRDIFGKLSYLTQTQVNAFRQGLEKIRLNAIRAITNQAPNKDLTVTKDNTSRVGSNACANVQTTINNLVSVIRTTLEGSTNPWKIEIRRGVFPNLHYFNPPKVVLDSFNNEVDLSLYQRYRDASTLVKLNKNSLLNAAFNTIVNSVPADKITKCRRDLGYIIDGLINDLRRIGNEHVVEISKLYKDISGNFYKKSDNTFVILPQERTLMSNALNNLRTNVALAIDNDYGDPTDFTPALGDYSTIKDFASGLIDVIRNTLTSDAYNPWLDTPINKGVNVLAGGVVVPRGTTFIAGGLRQPIIRPLYIAEEDLDYETNPCIFKLTSQVFSYGFTYFDHPGANSSHHKLFTCQFASDDFELNPASSAYYYAKIGTIFLNDSGYQGEAQETIIGAPAAPGDVSKTDSTKSSSPYIYNCSVRSDFGMGGMWADGDRVSGFKSMVTAQFTQVSIQKDPKAWEKWNSTIKAWVDLESFDSYATMKPALYIDYIHGVSETDLEPKPNSVRIKPSYRHTGFKGTNNAFVQIVSCFGIGLAQSYVVESGSDFSVTNSNTNFGEIALVADGFRKESFFVDSGFNWSEIIPPTPLTQADIIQYEFSRFNAAKTLDYYQTTGLRDRIYLVNGVQLPSVFTLKADTKAYLFYAGNEYPVDLVETLDGLASAVDEEGNFYIQVNPSTNTVFPVSPNLNLIAEFDDSRLSIKRVVDQRSTDEKVYRFVVTAPDSSRRIPPTGFIFNTGNNSVVDSGKIFWVYKSEQDGDNESQFIITLLGLNPDYSSQLASVLVPLRPKDYDVEPVLDIGSGEVISPAYNPSNSVTRRIAELLIETENLGYVPSSLDWELPSISRVSMSNVGVDNQLATVRFHRPSQIRCSGHTFEYVGYPNYSQGFPQFQRDIIPSSYQLAKNRKNILGGIVYYNGLDDKGNVWAGDVLTNLATGEEEKLTIVDTPPPATPAAFDTLEIDSRIVIGGSLEINERAIIIPSNGYVKIGSVRVFVANTPPTSGVYNVSDIIVKTSPSEGNPLLWRLISNSPQLVWEPIGGDTVKNLAITNAFNLPVGSTGTVAGNLTTSGSSTIGGSLVVNGTSASVTPVALSIAPTTTGTINNTSIGATTPSTVAATTLSTTGVATLASAVVTGNETVGGTLSVTGATNLTSLAVSGNETVGGTLSVTGATSLTATTVTGTLGVSGAATLGTAAVTGATTVGGTLTVTGATTLSSAAVTGNATVGGTLGVTGATTVGGTLGVTGNETVGGTLGVTGSTTLNSNLTANGATALVTLNPQRILVSPTGTDSAINNVVIGATTPRPATVTTLTTTGAATLASFGVAGSGTIAGNLTISGNLTVNGTNTINSTLNTTTSDPVLDIGGGNGGAALVANDGNDRGLLLQYFDTSQKKAFVGFVSGTGYLAYYNNAQTIVGNENKVDTANSVLGDIQAANFRGNLIGNASTATTLATPRTIAGVSFNGSANIALTTANITEGANLYYTDARARAAISSTGSIAYNNTTGVLSLPSINSTPIGATTPSTVAATTLSTTGAATLNSLAVTNAATVGGSNILVASSLGAANGIATLDATTKIPIAQIPTVVARTNVAQIFTANQGSAIVTVPYAANLVIDLSLGNKFEVTLTGNITSIDVTNLSSCFFSITFIQDATGSRTIGGFATKFKFAGRVVPVLSLNANYRDKLSCDSNGTIIECTFSKDFG